MPGSVAASHYTLPFLLADQYMLTSVLHERAASVLYLATQKDVRREVIVESLRPELVAHAPSADRFLQSARAQARFDPPQVASLLELFFSAGTWHVVRERVIGEPLDTLHARGGTLSAIRVVELLLHLCRGCIYLDIEGISASRFELHHAYLVEHGFRFDNMACAGLRQRDASHRFLRRAVQLIHPLLDGGDPGAARLTELMERMGCEGNWDTLGVLRFDEELTRLQLRLGKAC